MMDTRMTLIRQMTTDFFNKRLAQKPFFMMDTRMTLIRQMTTDFFNKRLAQKSSFMMDTRMKLIKQITTDFYYYFDWAVIRWRMPLTIIHLPYL